jgi:hypothetical protein
MQQLPKIVRQRLQSTANAGAHPDPNLLTAFAEKSLGERERVQVMDHLAQCFDCREAATLANLALEPAPVATSSPARPVWLSWPVLRWGALAACVVVVGAAVTLPSFKRAKMETYSAASQTAPAQKPAAENELDSNRSTDKLEAQPSPPATREKAPAPILAKQLDQAAAGKGSASTRSAVTPSNEEQAARTSPKRVPAAAPPLAAKSDGLVLKESDKKDRDEASAVLTAKTANEVVTVEAKSAASSEAAEVALDKAKDAPQKLQAAEPASGGTALIGRKVAEVTASENVAVFRNRAQLTPRWTLNAEGALQRSLDAGKTWETIPVADKLNFRALATVGFDVWLGGSGGALYHSSDAGAHWRPVKPAANGQVLSADITTLEFTDAQHGKLVTTNQETWITADGGRSWQKK